VDPDFQQRRIVTTHCAIRSGDDAPPGFYVKSRLVETSVDGESWQEVASEQANRQLKGKLLTGAFEVVGGGECCLIRLVNIGRDQGGSDHIVISVCEIFWSLFEEIINCSDVVIRFCFRRREGRAETLVTRTLLPSPMRSHLGEYGNLRGLDSPLLHPQTPAFAWFLQCNRYSWYRVGKK
jgi:hypothetical protein